MRRSGKYLNAREYAQRLALADNPDVADFGRDFLDALDMKEDSNTDEMERAINRYTESADDEVKTPIDKIEWLGKGSDTLLEVEKLIEDACPEYADMEIEEIIADMIKRLRPKQEYDL